MAYPNEKEEGQSSREPMREPNANDHKKHESRGSMPSSTEQPNISGNLNEHRPIERPKAPGRSGARGTAAMDEPTRKEVARKGGLAVSRNRQHMAEIGRKGGQSVSKNREHMAVIGRKGGAASRGNR